MNAGSPTVAAGPRISVVRSGASGDWPGMFSAAPMASHSTMDVINPGEGTPGSSASEEASLGGGGGAIRTGLPPPTLATSSGAPVRNSSGYGQMNTLTTAASATTTQTMNIGVIIAGGPGGSGLSGAAAGGAAPRTGGDFGNVGPTTRSATASFRRSTGSFRSAMGAQSEDGGGDAFDSMGGGHGGRGGDDDDEDDDAPEVSPWIAEPVTMEAGPDVMGVPADPTECFACMWDLGSIWVNMPHEERCTLNDFIEQQMANRHTDANCIAISGMYDSIRSRINGTLPPDVRPLPEWNPATVRAHMLLHHPDPAMFLETRMHDLNCLWRKLLNTSVVKRHVVSGQRTVDRAAFNALNKTMEMQLKLYQCDPDEMAFGKKHRDRAGMVASAFRRPYAYASARFSGPPTYRYVDEQDNRVTLAMDDGADGSDEEEDDDDDNEGAGNAGDGVGAAAAGLGHGGAGGRGGGGGGDGTSRAGMGQFIVIPGQGDDGASPGGRGDEISHSDMDSDIGLAARFGFVDGEDGGAEDEADEGQTVDDHFSDVD